MERLNKFLAAAGIASRRACDELIEQGHVKVNGIETTALGMKIDAFKDVVEVDGKVVARPQKKVYIKLHKPAGLITSTTEQQGKTIYSLLKGVKERVFPVGRLDKDTSGLLLLTNDGEFANQISHPRYEHEKEYVCETTQPLTPTQLSRLKQGVDIGDALFTFPAKVNKLGSNRFSIVIHEGRNRQVRRMVEAVGNKVRKLTRVRMDKFNLGDLKEGQWEFFSI